MHVKCAILITRQIAETLGAAHKAGLTHRDIKPDNIMITPDDRVKILDFGLVKDEASLSTILTQTGRSLGTPAYMSPEQFKGVKDIDSRSDLYSLGVVLYEMTTGTPPFQGPSSHAFSRQHIEEIPERAFRKNPDIPRNLSLVIDRLLAKLPKDRYHNAEELISDLDRVEEGKPPKKIYKFRKSSRIPWYAWAAGIALFLLVISSIGFFLYKNQQSAKAKAAIDNLIVDARRIA